MLTPEQEKFLNYWQQQRLRKKQFLRKFSIGLPLGAAILIAIIINTLSGWYRRADKELLADRSLIYTILIAGLGIVVFITIFAAHHRWDRNESDYQELLKRKNQHE